MLDAHFRIFSEVFSIKATFHPCLLDKGEGGGYLKLAWLTSIIPYITLDIIISIVVIYPYDRPGMFSGGMPLM